MDGRRFGRSVPRFVPDFSRRRFLERAAIVTAVPIIVVIGFGTRGRARRPEAGASGSPVASPFAGSPNASTPRATPSASRQVRMTDELRFVPSDLTIGLGDTVVWLNDSAFPHTATGDPAQNPVAKTHPDDVVLPADAEPWGSPLLQPGETWSHTFTVPGEYRYICIPHVLSGMRGRVAVVS